jgi:hypothetical protein
MGIEDQIKESSKNEGKTSLNPFLIYIHPFLSLSLPPQKNFLSRKDIGGAFAPSPQVNTYD